MNSIPTPHDSFSREVLSKKENAKDFLANYLPPNILKLINLEEIEIFKDTFIEEELKDFYSDLLYKVNLMGRSGYIYTLFEHKSYFYKLTALQLLGYMVQIWKLHIKQTKEEPLPVIIPIVIYHSEEVWNIETRFSALIGEGAEELKAYIPDFEYLLCDLSKYSDEEIKGIAELRIWLLLLKYIFRPELKDELVRIMGLFKELEGKESEIEYLRTVIRYLMNATTEIELEDLRNAIEEGLSKKKGGEIMTIAEKLIQQERVNSKREAIEEALEVRFGFAPKDVVDVISKLDDISLLDSLFRDAVKVNSLEEFREISKRAIAKKEI